MEATIVKKDLNTFFYDYSSNECLKFNNFNAKINEIREKYKNNEPY